MPINVILIILLPKNFSIVVIFQNVVFNIVYFKLKDNFIIFSA